MCCFQVKEDSNMIPKNLIELVSLIKQLLKFTGGKDLEYELDRNCNCIL